MTFEELKKKSEDLYPAIILEKTFSHKKRQKMSKWGYILFSISVVLLIVSAVPIPGNPLASYTSNFKGLLFLTGSFWLCVYVLEAMYFSYYFKEDSSMDFSVAQVVYDTDVEDVTGSFLRSSLGVRLMMRLGITQELIDIFLEKRKQTIKANEFMLVANDDDPYITLSEYARSLIHFDHEFYEFLEKRKIDAKTYKGAIDWISHNQLVVKEKEAWWKKENLQRKPSLGKNWAYGQVYHLENYGHPLYEEKIYRTMGEQAVVYEDTVHSIERILLKETGANVLLLGQQSTQTMSIVAALGKYIHKGEVNPYLETKRIFVLNWQSVIDAMREKVDVEVQLTRIFAQTANSGNVIMVIPNMPGFVESAHALEVDILDIIGDVLNSSNLQVIATSNIRDYHQSLETHKDMMSVFERVQVPELDDESVRNVLSVDAVNIESNLPVIFTYQALNTAAISATRYFTEDATTDRAYNLLQEAALRAVAQDRFLVLREDVEEIVEQRTGVPVGDVSNEEKELLTNLENILHKKIIGQDMAIDSLATSLRRSRAGLTNPNRPLGSFLFLGPTGVGKTATTKALAETFFKNTDSIIRVDMSEFSGDNALEKLIGSMKEDMPGTLSSKIREKKYGVLLLDEFEKASKKVHDLFLQILDEGYFTDGRGEKVNARNLLIIATSNAGSDIIYKMTQSGNDASLDTNNIVDTIIEQKIFRPELINRFDGTIIFHALTKDHLEKVSGLMLEDLEVRLGDKNLKIEKTPELIEFLVETGSNQVFGARAMNRAIQNEVEKVIAEGLIAGKISTGDKIKLVKSEQSDGTSSLKLVE